MEHVLRPCDLRLESPRICPECINQFGFIEAHFDLSVMIACPIHRKQLLSLCRRCNKSLSWYRPGLLECDCGASLREPQSIVASQETLDVLDIVRRKVLRLSIPNQYSSGIPVAYLAPLRLCALLFLIDDLGLRQSSRVTNIDDYDRIVPFASHLLAHWPSNYLRNLEQEVSRDLFNRRASAYHFK